MRGLARGAINEGLGTIFMIEWERFSRYGVALSAVGHVALLLGLAYIGTSAVQPAPDSSGCLRNFSCASTGKDDSAYSR